LFRKVVEFFRGRGHRVEGIAALEEGHAQAMIVGDPFANGAQIVIARVDGELHALDSLCPHAADGHFNDGKLIQGRYVYCPAHNYRFEPQTGKPVGAVCKRATRYRLVVDGDDCIVFV
jgi:nitrite reductase/ring-hydroxylating ferredoxin subunit